MYNLQYSLWFEYQVNTQSQLSPIHDKTDDAVEVTQMIFYQEDDLNNFLNSFSEKGFLPSYIKKVLIDKEVKDRLLYVQVSKQFPFIIHENAHNEQLEKFKVIRKKYGQHYQELSIKQDLQYILKLIYAVLVIQRNLWNKYFCYQGYNFQKQWFVQQITVLMLLQNQRPTDRHLEAIIKTAYEIKSYLIKALHLDRDIRNHLIEASIKQIDLIEASNLPKPIDDEFTKLKYMGDIKYVNCIWDIMKTDYQQHQPVIRINDQKQIE